MDMLSSESVPIFLFPGMAMGERLFAAQKRALSNVYVVEWLTAEKNESLRHYAARMARHLNPGGPCIVGGASFGGVVALEVASHLNALGCLLIGSIRSPDQLPWAYRLASPIAAFGPDAVQRMSQLAATLGQYWLAHRELKRLRRLSSTQAAFQCWAICALLRWQPSPAARQVKVLQMHGEDDHVITSRRVKSDYLVHEGGHALSMFQPEVVTKFIQQAREQWSLPVVTDN